MSSNAPKTPKATALILGNHAHIAAQMIDEFREAGYDGKYSSTVEGAIELAAAEHFDALIIGGGVTDANAARIEKGIRALLPGIAIQRMNRSREPLYWLEKALSSRKTVDANKSSDKDTNKTSN
ncbi:MAG: hypothetical protein J4O01_04990 [Chloroflexi bacterium]|nr:hypothetical protein [Chloroflexota bacterium]MCH8115632.1 hypothetical protein [Chloroflexota bacterium]MCI0775111.1 hypothetical protein [Chloroflexota bacterium]MCI0803832.1 hypothetical protein [Chloroflexota bacterium]MCI0808429.1 hypothetical protein [Chloroflexota bacterium]